MIARGKTDPGQGHRFLGVNEGFAGSHEQDGHGAQVGAEDGTEAHVQLGIVDPSLSRNEFCHAGGIR